MVVDWGPMAEKKKKIQIQSKIWSLQRFIFWADCDSLLLISGGRNSPEEF